MIKRLGGMLVILCLLVGCGMNSLEVMDPSEILGNDQLDQENSDQTSVENTIQDGIFLKTVDDDLFYLDSLMNQYKLSDEVDYFDYDEKYNIVKIKKQDGRWVIWYLDNKKPEFISSAEEIKFGNNRRKIFYTGLENKDLFVLNSEGTEQIYSGNINMYDVVKNGEMILILNSDGTFVVVDNEGKVLYQKQNIVSYQYDERSKTVKLWHDWQIDVLQLEAKTVSLYKVYDDVTDWLMVPTYSPKFETTASLSNINFENGVGNLTVISKYYNQAFEVSGVVSYVLVDEGRYVYYLNEKNELFSLNIETQVTNFLGSAVSQLLVDSNTQRVVYKSEDLLYYLDASHVVHLVGEDVDYYEFNDDIFVYINGIQDLFLYQNGVLTKMYENVMHFVLGHNGIYYTVDNVVYYKTFNGTTETIVDKGQFYKSIFYQNDELYKMKLTLDLVDGYWIATDSENDVVYHFGENQTLTTYVWDGEQFIKKMGSYTVMVTSADVLNLHVMYDNQSESYITISLLDSTEIQLSENEYFYTLKDISESKALQLLSTP
ncbi:MAG TPA: hypothetical protein DCY20_11560 [Firmicutes bacterium]|nr:hypothetical protein [Bacillota bacterium]